MGVARAAAFLVVGATLVNGSVSRTLADGEELISFEAVWALGDSLSDDGNLKDLLFEQAGIDEPPSAQGYDDGRYTDGRLWIERLAPLISTGELNNLAFGGAYAGDANLFLSDVPTGLLAQVENVSGQKNDLATIWVGANDYFGWLQNTLLINTAVPNSCIAAGLNALIPPDFDKCTDEVIDDIEQGIDRLIGNGIRNFLIVNLPDLGATPFANSISTFGSTLPVLLNVLTRAHNLKLALMVDRLRKQHSGGASDHGDVKFVLLDVFAGLEAISSASERFGLTNTTQSCLSVTLEDPLVREKTGACPPKSPEIPDSAGFLFWDQVHPTATTHDLVGIFAFLTLENANRLPSRFQAHPFIAQYLINRQSLGQLVQYAQSGQLNLP